MKVVVIGAKGRVGSELCRLIDIGDYEVVKYDADHVISEEDYIGVDLVVLTVPASESIGVLKNLSKCYSGVVIDVSFRKDVYTEFDDLVVIPSMGWAPGFSNMLAAHGFGNNVTIYSGGNPDPSHLSLDNKWRYYSTWNIQDAMSMFTGPVADLQDGLACFGFDSSVLDADFNPVHSFGVYEAIPTSGLSTLTQTAECFGIKHAKEFTLRHPGFFRQARMAYHSGFWNEEFIGNAWRPQGPGIEDVVLHVARGELMTLLEPSKFTISKRGVGVMPEMTALAVSAVVDVLVSNSYVSISPTAFGLTHGSVVPPEILSGILFNGLLKSMVRLYAAHGYGIVATGCYEDLCS